MIPELGHFALIIALGLACILAFFPLLGASMGISTWTAMARPLARGQFVFTAIAFMCLVSGFISSDFSVAYVAQNSNSASRREQGCGSFVKLRNSRAITCVSRLEAECFNQQSIRPRLNQRFLK